MRAVTGCPYSCSIESDYCDAAFCGSSARGDARKSRLEPVPVVDLPLGVTEDRVVGALDIEKALVHGEKSFDPGLLAVASDTPPESDAVPVLIDRFGLAVDVRTTSDITERIEVIRRRDAFERDPDGFTKKWSRQDGKLRRQIVKAREAIDGLEPSDEILGKAAEICIALETDGSRGELTLMRAARAFAALEGDAPITLEHLKAVAPMALGHRLRRNPLDESSAGVRVQRALDEFLP